MRVKTFLDKVAYVVSKEYAGEQMEEYRSKFDDSYITFVGMENHIKFLAKLEITEELSHGLGFSTKDHKWYGWSHSAIFGFEIGSECKKGDCAYVAGTPEELINDHVDWMDYEDEDKKNQRRAECQILDDRSGIRILHTPIIINVAPSIESAVKAMEDDNIGSMPEEPFDNGYSIIECGRGEWVAKTMEDAKQMAKDFSSGVS